jgi:hypothetical protein
MSRTRGLLNLSLGLMSHCGANYAFARGRFCATPHLYLAERKNVLPMHVCMVLVLTHCFQSLAFQVFMYLYNGVRVFVIVHVCM